MVEPSPFPSRESRFVVLLDAQEASYFAASLRISSFSRTVSCAIALPFVRYMFLKDRPAEFKFDCQRGRAILEAFPFKSTMKTAPIPLKLSYSGANARRFWMPTE